MLSSDNINGGISNRKMHLALVEDVHISWGSFKSILQIDSFEKCLVFVDPLVLSSNEYLLDIEDSIETLTLIPTNLGEFNKNIDSLVSILTVIENAGIGRRSCKIYAVGGGALLDTVSMACSLYRRGIDIVKVPTTLLSFIDAAVGIKTGINFLGQRNRLGTYNAKFNVILDPALLGTLSQDLIRQGLGEILKIATIKSKALFSLLENNKEALLNPQYYQNRAGKEILDLAIQLMLEELHDNPKEDVLKRCVDFGHTFSPLVEMESMRRSTERPLAHGFAVSYDCLLTTFISKRRGLIDGADFSRIVNLFTYFDMNYGNPIYSDVELIWASLLEMTRHRGGSQNIPIPISIGEFDFINDLSFEELVNANDHLLKTLSE